MRLDDVRVQPVHDMASTSFRKDWGGCSLLVPANESARFNAGGIHRFSDRASRESYEVTVIAKYETTGGTCVVIKLWNPN